MQESYPLDPAHSFALAFCTNHTGSLQKVDVVTELSIIYQIDHNLPQGENIFAGLIHALPNSRCVPQHIQQLYRRSPIFAILIEFTTVRRWRNWQTHQLEVLAPKRHRGSSPLFRTKFLSSGPAGLTWKAAFKMNFLLYFVIVLHVIVSLFLIGVVLLQQGRSADLAGAFGGQGSQTAFGPRAAANVLTRLTTWSAIIFMLTSITLTVLYQRSTTGSKSVLENSSQSAPAKPGK